MYKNVTYKDHAYHIGYHGELHRDLVSTINHTLFIDKVNDKPITYFEHKWSDVNKDRKNIIKEAYLLIKEYIARQNKPEFSYLNEFENWDGNLDKWDE